MGIAQAKLHSDETKPPTKRTRMQLIKRTNKKKKSKLLPVDLPSTLTFFGTIIRPGYVGSTIREFLDLQSHVQLFATCKAGRFCQTSSQAWRPLLEAHGLTPKTGTLLKRTTAAMMNRRYHSTPTVAMRYTLKSIKTGTCCLPYYFKRRRSSSQWKFFSECQTTLIGFQIKSVKSLHDKIMHLQSSLKVAETEGDMLRMEELRKESAMKKSILDAHINARNIMTWEFRMATLLHYANSASKHLGMVMKQRRK